MLWSCLVRMRWLKMPLKSSLKIKTLNQTIIYFPRYLLQTSVTSSTVTLLAYISLATHLFQWRVLNHQLQLLSFSASSSETSFLFGCQGSELDCVGVTDVDEETESVQQQLPNVVSWSFYLSYGLLKPQEPNQVKSWLLHYPAGCWWSPDLQQRRILMQIISQFQLQSLSYSFHLLTDIYKVVGVCMSAGIDKW